MKNGTVAQHRHRQTTLRDLLHAYSIKVTPKKKGRRQEERRIAALKRDKLAAFSVENTQRSGFRDYRDRRAAKVSPSTVNRELALWSVVIAWGRAELDVPLPGDLFDGLKLGENPARERRLAPGEFDRLIAVSPDWLQRWIVLAIETGMRRGELGGLQWSDVDLRRRVCRLATTKNGTARDVPLSSRAVAALEAGVRPLHGGRVFDIHTDNVTKEFATACKRAKITGLRLHDLRAECVSRLFERGLDLNSVKAVSGHKSSIILRYCRASDAETLAQKLG